MDYEEFFKKLYAPSELPSEDMSRDWHYANAPSVTSFNSSEKTGKWCLMPDKTTVDKAWQVIKEATQSGSLLLAKVSTRAISASRPSHVICVYTTDWEDQADLMRVREALRELGFTQKLGYKRDIDTINRIYGENEWLLHA